MSTTVTYKGNTIATVDNDTVTLDTAGTWVEDDFTLVDVSGGGLPDEIIETVSLLNPKYAYAYISTGSAPTYSPTYTDAIYINPGSARVQVGYLRFGPIDLTNIDSIQTLVRINSAGTLINAIFADKGSDARSYDVEATDPSRVSIVNPSNNAMGTNSLDVTALSGEYYVYVGTDSMGSSWSNARQIWFYSVTMTKAS